MNKVLLVVANPTLSEAETSQTEDDNQQSDQEG